MEPQPHRLGGVDMPEDAKPAYAPSQAGSKLQRTLVELDEVLAVLRAIVQDPRSAEIPWKQAKGRSGFS